MFREAGSDRKLNCTLACPIDTCQEPQTDQRPIKFASVDLSLLDEPYPNREDRVDREVRDHSPEGGSLGCVPAQFPIRIEQDTGNCNSRVPQCEPDISEEVRLRKVQGIQIRGEDVVGCVLEF